MQFPVSTWEECDAVVEAAHEASVQMRGWPGDRFARYLEAFAKRVEARAEELITTANLETAYPIVPRLQDVELPVRLPRPPAHPRRLPVWPPLTPAPPRAALPDAVTRA